MTVARRQWALVAMGAWMAGTICVSVVATENFYTVDRLLAARANTMFAAAVDRLDATESREFLRYLSSELNRLYFQLWNAAQIVLGGLVLWLIAGSRKQEPAHGSGGSVELAVWGVITMLAIVVLMLAFLTPSIVTLGRSLDFVPRDPAPPGMSRFWVLHAAYTSLEMLKLLVGASVTASIVKRSGLPAASTAAA
jgi:hypothetical protein